MYRVLKRKIHNKSGSRVRLLQVTRAVAGKIFDCALADYLKIVPLQFLFISSRKLKMCPSKLKFLT